MSITTRRHLLLGAAAAMVVSAAPAAAQSQGFTRRDVAHIQVRKSERFLELISRDRKILKRYRVQLGKSPIGHKRFQGDGRTPEGVYRIDRRNAQSAFHLSLGISYPSSRDRAYAASKGRSPGGDIFIHGQPNGREATIGHDWTRGCIAVSNENIRELWSLIPVGCPIMIYA
ncbi:L,D-transpeptidase family protein [Epibacterium sp. DP7N7-1]|nr:L,D-transpeptidase family protein [Epibacterium sp. DP7N7-1]